MGRRNTLLVLSLVLAACGTDGDASDDGGDPAATSATTSITATTTQVAETTTSTTASTPKGPLTLDGPGPLEPGATYAVDFFVPLEIAVDEDGWVARFVFGEVVSLSFGDSALVFFALTPEAEPEGIVESIVNGSDTIAVVRDPSMGTLGTWSISTADVVIPEHPVLGCGGPGVWYIGRGGPPGATLRTVGDSDFGIVQCRTTRIWAIDVGSQVVTVLGVASDNDRFEEFMPIFEEFLQNHVAFGDADE